MKKAEVAVFAMVMVTLLSAGAALGGKEENPVDYFSPGKKLSGTQTMTWNIKGEELGTRTITLMVDGQKAKVTMTGINISKPQWKPVLPRDFISDMRFEREGAAWLMKVVDPKDNGQFTFRYEDGVVKLEEKVTGNARMSVTILK
jgi:hypothetical protein